jgi:hypothetical protein
VSKQLSKSEFYNSLVGLREKTGQGMELKLAERVIPKFLIDELVEEGLLEYNKRNAGYFGTETWISITYGYSVERYYNDNLFQPLTFIRTFLGNEIPIDLGKDNKITREKLLKEEGFKDDYAEWLVDNFEELSKIKNTPLLEEKIDKPADEVIEYLRNMKCYKSNNSVEECHRTIDGRFLNNQRLLHTYKELLLLEKDNPKYQDAYNEHKADYDKLKIEMQWDKKLLHFLRSHPNNTLVQEVY